MDMADEAPSPDVSWSVPVPAPPSIEDASNNDAETNSNTPRSKMSLQSAGSDYGRIYKLASLQCLSSPTPISLWTRATSDTAPTAAPPSRATPRGASTPRPAFMSPPRPSSYRKEPWTSSERSYAEDENIVAPPPPPDSPMSLQHAGSDYSDVYRRKSLMSLGQGSTRTSLGSTRNSLDSTRTSLAAVSTTVEEDVEKNGECSNGIDVYDDDEDYDLEFILPRLNICIMIVGTHGDVLPFCILAKELQFLGHRVRIATHEVHRRTVSTRNIEFYPMAGDPRKLSEWTVQSGGHLLGEIRDGLQDPTTASAKAEMVKNIITSCWGAVSAPDPIDVYVDSLGGGGETSMANTSTSTASRTFVADAVIANPPCMGHIHVCEALAIPLHIMFPQPWYYGTKSFPHPYSGLSYENPKSQDSSHAKLNYASYDVFETLQSLGLGNHINRWRRKVLQLPKIPLNHKYSNPIVQCKIPFSAMWSPSFVPKPEDWPEQCRVVGAFSECPAGGGVPAPVILSAVDSERLAPLIQWINQGSGVGEEKKKPVFIGFGSMVIDDTQSLQRMIMDAAEATNTRIVVQSSWSKMEVSGELCHNVGPVAHDWLLPQCCAVIHHGGAGTTAAGLRYQLPTFVCPFFGDQYMWGEMVHRAGVGPEPCPISKLTTDILIDKLRELTSPTIKKAAAALAVKMDNDDGVVNALEHFWSALPRDSMMCSLGLIMGKSLLAKYRTRNGIPISPEVASVLSGASGDYRIQGAYTLVGLIPLYGLAHVLVAIGVKSSFMNRLHKMLPRRDDLRTNATATHALRSRGGYDTFCQGLIAIILEFLELLAKCLYQLYHVPDKFARTHGFVGCIYGILVSPLYFCYAVFRALFRLIDRLGVAVANGAFGKQWLYLFDSSAMCKVYRDVSTLSETRNLVSEKSVLFVLEAHQIATDARNIYLRCKPKFIDDRWHYREVRIDTLMSTLIDNDGKSRRFLIEPTSKKQLALKLSEIEFQTLVGRLNWAKTRMEYLSYNRFCLFIGEAVQDRFFREATVKDAFSEAVSCYMT